MASLRIALGGGMSARAIPGFRTTLGITLGWVLLIVVLPLASLIWKSSSLSASRIFEILTEPRIVSAFQVSFGCAALAAVINAVGGSVVAWSLVRYEIPGRRFLDALVDIPFALPTAVAGITLTTLYAPNGWVGRWLAPLGIEISYHIPGIVVALVFVGLPFVVRTVQPVLEDFPVEAEEAAALLGASRWTAIRRVILPSLLPAVATGTLLAFARCVGEYGSVVFIAGNMPGRTEILPLLIVTRLEEYRYEEATAIALAMLLLSLLLLLLGNRLQTRWVVRGRR